MTVEKDGTVLFDQDLAPGSDATVPFAQPGSYALYCKYHRSQGMMGNITVS